MELLDGMGEEEAGMAPPWPHGGVSNGHPACPEGRITGLTPC